jgi:predicted nucleic acid-binding protein
LDWLSSKQLRPDAFAAFLADVEEGAIVVAELLVSDYRRVRELVVHYADMGLGFVDAAVLAIVERLGEPKLATPDHRHFRVMRPRHVDALVLLPAD